VATRGWRRGRFAAGGQGGSHVAGKRARPFDRGLRLQHMEPETGLEPATLTLEGRELAESTSGNPASPGDLKGIQALTVLFK